MKTESSAVISDSGVYRYCLGREWENRLPCLGWIMLNPSTADATQDDPTIRKCIGFARRNNYGSIMVGNIFAYRATKPKDIPADVAIATGDENMRWLKTIRQRCLSTVFAWGDSPRAEGEKGPVCDLFPDALCLGLTRGGMPKHPLMLAWSTQLIKYGYLRRVRVERGVI